MRWGRGKGVRGEIGRGEGVRNEMGDGGERE